MTPGAMRADSAAAKRSCCSPVILQPRSRPPPSISLKSYSGSIFSAVSGSMHRRSPSSMSSITWGSSKGAFSRTWTRGGMRSITVPSVARISAPEPGVKSYRSKSIAASTPRRISPSDWVRSI